MPDATSSVAASATEQASSALLLQNDAHRESHDSKDPSAPSAKAFSEGSPLAALPMQLNVTIPIPGFRVQHLLALEKGAVLQSRWHHADDVPVWCGGVQLVWTEFEVIDQKLAVRVTRVG
jgi:flagellar motor switch protein FliN